MKQLIIIATVVLASCTSSKYAAHFQKSNQDLGYHEVTDKTPVVRTPPEPANFVASTERKAAIITSENTIGKADAAEQLRTKYQNMSKGEKKAFRKELVREIKKIKAAQSSPTGMTGDPRTWDHDLQLAAIFGTVGIVALIIGTTFFWVIGAVSLIIGVVFGVKWLTQQ